jgi:all-trans-retinol dehydrogenase (NAD+)
MSVAVRRTLNLAASLAFNPALTAPLLWLLTYGPQALRTRLADRVGALRDPRQRALVLKVLKWLLAAGVVRGVNRGLNSVALNGWRVGSEKGRWRWAGEIAVVTGGSSGFGELIVKRLANKGVKVAVLDVRPLPAGLQGCRFWFYMCGVVVLTATDAHISFFSCDVTDPEAVFATAEEVQRKLGTPTVLVNNAGILDAHSILGTSHEYLRKIFDVNVLSNWTTVQAFLPGMIAQNKGHIVTVASMASYLGVAGMADYTATKAAVLAFHECSCLPKSKFCPRSLTDT